MMKKAFCSAKKVVVFSEGMRKRGNLHLRLYLAANSDADESKK